MLSKSLTLATLEIWSMNQHIQKHNFDWFDFTWELLESNPVILRLKNDISDQTLLSSTDLLEVTHSYLCRGQYKDIWTTHWAGCESPEIFLSPLTQITIQQVLLLQVYRIMLD